MNELTSDTFFNGRLTVFQCRDGYRFSIDSVLLAGHVACRPGDRVLDLGTGCGIIAMMLAFRNPQTRIYGVELQKDLAALAARNVRENQLSERVHILEADLTSLRPADIGGEVDIIVSNPPYRKHHSGRMNPDRQKAVARHEITASLQDIADAAARMLTTGGRLVVIYPIERLVDLFVCLRARRVEPKSAQTICSRAGAPGKLVVVTANKGGRPGIQIPPPLHIYRPDGAYTVDVDRMFHPDFTTTGS